jgi:hypothetical protein
VTIYNYNLNKRERERERKREKEKERKIMNVRKRVFYVEIQGLLSTT